MDTIRTDLMEMFQNPNSKPQLISLSEHKKAGWVV
jgi:hypothetical protein